MAFSRYFIVSCPCASFINCAVLFQLLYIVLVARYFTLFMRLLNMCSEELEGGKEKGQVTGLRNVTVQAMSNLLSANIDSGLMHSISKLSTPHGALICIKNITWM